MAAAAAMSCTLAHSRREWASVPDMAAAAATIVELARVWAERPA